MHAMSDADAQHYAGMSAAHAYTRVLLADPRVQSISVHRYRSPPSLQQRVALSPGEQSLVDRAIALRQTAQLPFWYALFMVCLRGGTPEPQLFRAAFFHNGPGEAITHDRDALAAGILEELVGQGAANIGLSSEVHDAQGRVWHLPLLDFHCAISPHNEALAALVCSQVMPGGWLLVDSGDSYHACGFELLTPEGRIHMLGMALLAAPIVDSHYVAHQLQQDVSSIRISKGGKTSRGPIVVRAARDRGPLVTGRSDQGA